MAQGSRPCSRKTRGQGGFPGCPVDAAPCPARLEVPIGAVAQLGERCNRTAEVVSSILISSTKNTPDLWGVLVLCRCHSTWNYLEGASRPRPGSEAVQNGLQPMLDGGGVFRVDQARQAEEGRREDRRHLAAVFSHAARQGNASHRRGRRGRRGRPKIHVHTHSAPPANSAIKPEFGLSPWPYIAVR